MDIDHDSLEINPDFEVHVGYVGHGKHKVVMVDHFCKHSDKVLKLATDLPYTDNFSIVGNFPGVRAKVDIDTRHIVDAISKLWGTQLYPFFDPQPAVFQAIVTKNYRLNIGQRQPHIDPDLTAMVYLNPENSCGGAISAPFDRVGTNADQTE